MSNQNLQNNPNVFYYSQTDKNGEITEVFIDFQQVVTFCRTGKEGEGESVKIAVKYVNHSKAQFSFPNSEPYIRLCEEYNAYVNQRNELKAMAQEMAKFLVSEVKEEMAEETRSIVSGVVNKVEESISKEIQVFRETIVAQAKQITDTALSHQKDINEENAKHLEKTKELQDAAELFVNKIKDFSDRMESVVTVVNSVAPTADSLLEKEEEAIEEMNKEVSGY